MTAKNLMKYINKNLLIEKIQVQNIAKKFGTPAYCYSYEQLKKNISKRIENFERIYNFFKDYPDYFILPDQNKQVKTGWLAYPIIINNKSKINWSEEGLKLKEEDINYFSIFDHNDYKYKYISYFPYHI